MSGAAVDLLADVALATEMMDEDGNLLAEADAPMAEEAAPNKRAREEVDEAPATQEAAESSVDKPEEVTEKGAPPPPMATGSIDTLGNDETTRSVAAIAGSGTLLGAALDMFNQLIDDGYTEAEAHAFAMELQSETTTQPLVYVLDQTERFSIKIFEEAFADSLEKRIGTVLTKRSLDGNATVGLYQQYDAGGFKHTALTVEFADTASAAVFKGGALKHEGVSFKVIELSEWLTRIGAIKDEGKRYAIVFGPWPFMPTFETVDKYKGLLTSSYGNITNVTIYKDRTITIGFALGGRETPQKKKPIRVVHKGQHMGTLHAIHNIRALGLSNCLTCCGINGWHGPECEGNKRNFDAHMAKKKKLHAQSGARARDDGKEDGEWEQVKPAHRGKRGGSGRAPAAVVQKQSWADIAGA